MLKWAADRHIHLTDSAASPNVLNGSVENVPANSRVCKGWAIALKITLDASDRVAEQEVRTHGNCL